MFNLVLYGYKCGMISYFTKAGLIVPATIIAIKPCEIIKLKKSYIDGYNAFQLLPKSVNKLFRHCGFKRVVESKISFIKCFENPSLKLYAGQYLNIRSCSKGKGFQGTVKRHNFKCQDFSHGNSLSHRVPGSTGQNQFPGKVFKNKKMSGQMGNSMKTILNSEVLYINNIKGLLIVKGCLSGSISSFIKIGIKKND